MKEQIEILLQGYKEINYEDIPHSPGIYLFRNNINDKVYIGQANDMRIRFFQHKKSINDGLYFHKALLKYGLYNFKYYILETFPYIDKDEQNRQETYYIKKFNSNNLEFGYNLTSGGNGHSGYPISEEQKKIISEKNSKYCIAYNFITHKYIEANSRKELCSKLIENGYSECNEQKVYDTINNNSSYTGDYLIANSIEELNNKIESFTVPNRQCVYLYNYVNPDGIQKFESIADAEKYIKKFCKISSGHLYTAIEKNNQYIKDFLFGLSESELNEKIKEFSPYVYFYNIENKFITTFKTIDAAVKFFTSIGIKCNPTSFSKAKLGKQKQASGFLVAKNKKELIEKIAMYTKEEVQEISDLIVHNNLSNEQFAINWNDYLNEISVRY